MGNRFVDSSIALHAFAWQMLPSGQSSSFWQDFGAGAGVAAGVAAGAGLALGAGFAFSSSAGGIGNACATRNGSREAGALAAAPVRNGSSVAALAARAAPAITPSANSAANIRLIVAGGDTTRGVRGRARTHTHDYT